MKAILIGAAVAALAVPAMAQMAGAQMAGGPAGKWAQPTTRDDAEAKAREKFAERDTNKDGFITSEEIRAGVEARMGKMRGLAFDRMDTDKNGTISREEFTTRRDGPSGPRIVERRVERMTPDGAKDDKRGRRDMRVMMIHKGGPGGGHMIMMTDTDKDGRISQAEAVGGALRLFDQTDSNRDGTVTHEERRAAMQAWGAKMRERMGAMPPPPPPPAG